MTRALASVVLLAVLSTLAVAGERRVLGTGGQADLILDYGRPLSRVRGDATPIERTRLEARTILRDPSRPLRERLEHVVALVRARLPYATPEAYAAFEGGGAHPVARLSEAVATGVAICREHAWLLAGLLRDGGLRARVRYGEVFTRGGVQLGSHAWVELREGGDVVRLDPSARQAVTMRTTRVPLDVTLAGVRHRVVGSRSRQVVYAPTRDRSIVD